MKTINYKRHNLLFAVIVILTFTSCVDDNNFSVPETSTTAPNITASATIIKIKNDFIQNFNTNRELIYTFRENDTPTYVSGYVVSSDAAGNFYKKLIVQDAIENPTFGIEIRINNTTLSQTYEVGRKIYIKLDGLTVTYDDGESTTRISPTNNIPGKYTLGFINHTGEVEDIPSTSYRNYIVKSATVGTIIPTAIMLEDVEEKHINTLVKLETTQFEKSQLGKSFAGEPNDQYDGFRTLFECETESTILLQTSTFSSFKSNLVPTGKGQAKAILTKDFRAEFNVLIVNTPSDLAFTNTERCDPPVLDCSGDTETATVIFEENFESITSTTALTNAGWTNINTNGGSTTYSVSLFNGNRYAQASAFRSGENPLEIWLISPSINLDSSTEEQLTFDTKTGYNNGAALSVWVSTDFSGNPTTATWLRIDSTLADGPSSGYEADFTSSGVVNLSCLSGNIHLAFKYLGGDGEVTTTFQVDNIKITGN